MSLTTTSARLRFAKVRLPPHIVVVNYAALPLSGDLTERARDGYLRLRAYGPNDGLTLIADEILPG